MAETLLPAPTVSIASLTGTVLPAAEATSMSGFTGVNFANNGAIMLRYVVGASGAGTITVNFSRTVEGQSITAFSIAAAASTVYLIGPFSVQDLNDSSGLVHVDKTGTMTGDSAGLYFIPPPKL